MPADIFAPVGVDFQTSFQHSTASVPDGSFTKLVYKNGALVSSAGITITYVSDQEYTVNCLTSTGFPATSGVFDLVIYLTADSTKRWAQTIRVTPYYSQVAGGYVQPTAIFASAASNGRIMSGTPLAGATVTIVRPNGTVLTQIVTDINGLWGTVGFDVAGTYTLTAVKAGYSTGNGSIVVSGATATGPGADISLTVISATSGITAGSLWAYARRMYQDHTGTKADTEIRELVDESLYMVATSREWPWYLSSSGITIRAAYTTGTVAVTSGSAVVTLTSGTWPTWAASAEILMPDGVWYNVLSRDSGTQITLSFVYPGTTVTAGGYTISQYAYSLPTDTRKISQITRGQNWVWGPSPTSRALLEQAKRTWSAGAGMQQYWAIERDKLYVWPYTTGVDATLDLLYYRRPALLLSSIDDVDWDPMQLEVIRRAIDYQVATRGTCAAGDRRSTMEAFDSAVSRASDQDRTATSVDIGLSNSGGADSLLWNVRITG
jgi:hypothetical protein